jgi:hypothetical protein
MTAREEIMKYLKRLEHPYPDEPNAMSKELNERMTLLSRATQLKADAKMALDQALGKDMAALDGKRTATELKAILAARTAETAKTYDLADGLHSDLVHCIGVGRTLVSNEKEYLRTFGSGNNADPRTGEIVGRRAQGLVP